MPSLFDQYSGLIAGAANANGVPVNLAYGLVQTESGFNPYAQNPNSSAYGFTQLVRGTAAQLGVNQYDPTQNAYGGMQYLASMPGSDWFTKVAHYYSGPGKITSDAIAYANKVFKNAGNFLNSGTGQTLESLGLAAATGGASLGITGIPGMGGGGSSWFDELKNWITSSGFFQRIALALVALILILGAVYTLKGKAE